MIQLYRSGNENYEYNGDVILMPESCAVKAELNGAWSCELVHPPDKEGKWKEIVEEAVVKLPSFNGEQLFRIKQKVKSDAGVTATLEPIFFDALDDCFLEDIRPTGKNGQEALNMMCAPNRKYRGESDITRTATAYYQYRNLIDCINGNDDNSFINRWGGEILFDNYTVKVNRKIGQDNGIEIRYGKNIQKDGIEEDVDLRETVTRIYPKAYNGYKMSGTGYVDSENINKYQTIKIATLTFDNVRMKEDADENAEGLIICNNQKELDVALEKKCKEQFESGLDKPKISIRVDLVLLGNADIYKEYSKLESVSLGDTVHCKHNKLGIDSEARIVSLEYDCLKDRVTAVEIGDFKYNYIDDVSSNINRIDGAIRPDGTVVGEQIQGLIDGVKAQMRAQSSAAKKSAVRAVLFEDLDEKSPTYGALCLGTMGFQIAGKRTADGRDWDWKTFGTGQGFFADLIVAGTMVADRIRGGVLMSKNYEEGVNGFKFDLNEGLINAAQLLIETNKEGRMARGFRFNDGNLEILGVNGEINASIHICGSLPDNPDDIPSGWQDTTIFAGGEPNEFPYGGFWVTRGGKYAGISTSEFRFNPGKMTMNDKETKTGRLEFSDGTFVELVNGIVVGGNTKEGAF